ncbi:MAG: hypothetical protein Q8P59_07240 [Dehalococcoidia bacterium]|nr:hypothetical protein [Dehalococcoidia bacterium]
MKTKPETGNKPGQAEPEGTGIKVGDYVQLVGIVYEVNGYTARIQIADGTKVLSLSTTVMCPASPAAIEAYWSEAIEGLTPEAIIAREAEEKAAKANLKAEDAQSEGEDD